MEQENYFGDSDSDNEIQKELKNNINANEDNFDEDLMGDEEDRKYLASLTELEREKILMERHAKRED